MKVNQMPDNSFFICPHCQKLISSTMSECVYCGIPLDETVILSGLENQKKVNSACGLARHFRTLILALLLMFLFSLLPGIGFVFAIIFCILLLAVPVLFVYWLIRFGRITSQDPELNIAKKILGMGFLVWMAFPVVYFVIYMLVE